MKKEVIKKKIKIFLKNIKKIFKKLIKFVKDAGIQLWNKFMKLPKKVRLVFYIWFIVIIFVCLFIAISSASKRQLNKYESFEKSMSEASLKYVEDKNIYATKSNKLKINLETLVDEKYLGSFAISDKSCDGISVVYYDDFKEEYIINSYLNCKKYTTDNYWDYK